MCTIDNYISIYFYHSVPVQPVKSMGRHRYTSNALCSDDCTFGEVLEDSSWYLCVCKPWLARWIPRCFLQFYKFYDAKGFAKCDEKQLQRPSSIAKANTWDAQESETPRRRTFLTSSDGWPSEQMACGTPSFSAPWCHAMPLRDSACPQHPLRKTNSDRLRKSCRHFDSCSVFAGAK